MVDKILIESGGLLFRKMKWGLLHHRVSDGLLESVVALSCPPKLVSIGSVSTSSAGAHRKVNLKCCIEHECLWLHLCPKLKRTTAALTDINAVTSLFIHQMNVGILYNILGYYISTFHFVWLIQTFSLHHGEFRYNHILRVKTEFSVSNLTMKPKTSEKRHLWSLLMGKLLQMETFRKHV